MTVQRSLVCVGPVMQPVQNPLIEKGQMKATILLSFP